MNNEKLFEVVNKSLVRSAYSQKLKVHIKLIDGTWRNGFVQQILDNCFIFLDGVNGKESFFYLQIEKINPYINAGERVPKND